MTTSEVQRIVFTVDRQVVELAVTVEHASKGSVNVAVMVNHRISWNYREPSWRQIRVGTGDLGTYWWSARRLVLLPSAATEAPEDVEVDEDLLLAFAVAGSWLLVCEASIRWIEGGVETSRLDLADIVLEAYWRGSALRVLDAGHRLMDVTLVAGTLVAQLT